VWILVSVSWVALDLKFEDLGTSGLVGTSFCELGGLLWISSLQIWVSHVEE
jgi:hypothetical protein